MLDGFDTVLKDVQKKILSGFDDVLAEAKKTKRKWKWCVYLSYFFNYYV